MAASYSEEEASRTPMLVRAERGRGSERWARETRALPAASRTCGRAGMHGAALPERAAEALRCDATVALKTKVTLGNWGGEIAGPGPPPQRAADNVTRSNWRLAGLALAATGHDRLRRADWLTGRIGAHWGARWGGFRWGASAGHAGSQQPRSRPHALVCSPPPAR